MSFLTSTYGIPALPPVGTGVGPGGTGSGGPGATGSYQYGVPTGGTVTGSPGIELAPSIPDQSHGPVAPANVSTWSATDPCSNVTGGLLAQAECRLQQLLDIGLWNVGLLVLAGFGLYVALRPEINSAVRTARKAAVVAA